MLNYNLTVEDPQEMRNSKLMNLCGLIRKSMVRKLQSIWSLLSPIHMLERVCSSKVELAWHAEGLRFSLDSNKGNAAGQNNTGSDMAFGR